MERELKYYNTDKLVTYNNPSFINKMMLSKQNLLLLDLYQHYFQNK